MEKAKDLHDLGHIVLVIKNDKSEKYIYDNSAGFGIRNIAKTSIKIPKLEQWLKSRFEPTRYTDKKKKLKNYLLGFYCQSKLDAVMSSFSKNANLEEKSNKFYKPRTSFSWQELLSNIYKLYMFLLSSKENLSNIVQKTSAKFKWLSRTVIIGSPTKKIKKSTLNQRYMNKFSSAQITFLAVTAFNPNLIYCPSPDDAKLLFPFKLHIDSYLSIQLSDDTPIKTYDNLQKEIIKSADGVIATKKVINELNSSDKAVSDTPNTVVVLDKFGQNFSTEDLFNSLFLNFPPGSADRI